MKKLIVATAAAILLGAPLAYSANTAPGSMPQIAAANLPQHCTNLEQQWAKEEGSHKSAKEMAEAKKEYEEGLKLCKQDKHKEGIEKIEHALQLIGVKPVKE